MLDGHAGQADAVATGRLFQKPCHKGQARAVLAQPRSGVVHSLIEILVSLLPLFVVGYAAVDWLRGNTELNVFQAFVMVQATLATLIDVVIFTWFSLRLNKLSIQAIQTHVG